MTWKDPLQDTFPLLPLLHPCYIFCVTRPPHPHYLLGQEGRGGLSFLLAQRAAPPTGHPGGDGRGCPERATPAGRKGVPLATEAGRQPDLPSYRTPGSCLFRPRYREPGVDYDLLDPLGGDGCVDCGERHPAISRPESTAVSNWPVTLAGPCSAGVRGLPE